MRIPSIIMQGLIAGAILFIPNEVFAEKNNEEKQNSAAEQKTQNQSDLKQENAKVDIPEREPQKENVLKPEVSEASPKKLKGDTSNYHGSEKSYEAREKNAAAEKSRSSQQTKYSNGLKKSVPQGQLKKNVPINQPEKKKAETSKYVHTETIKDQSVLPKVTAEEEQNKKLFSSKRKNKEQQRKKVVSKLPNRLPSKELPQQPDSKAIPLTAGQSSSHSSSSKDAGNGGLPLANVKANLVLPLIFADSEKVSVYFSRMDLLRSQWVNAPPSMPPETAL
ncbi:hypothetical protein [Fictibacillus sp. BK138]|uniref:hypothetical protein n=1 Tax=Fictibacillus sp. BK138 TaxID=2512121 RepID=UPI001028F1B4|nr:hypothetical protein [Fictibacillus sp. BK138]RZT16384.1 hypothetical protein EV282_3491 [Fictibacillus sp. BK138]